MRILSVKTFTRRLIPTAFVLSLIAPLGHAQSDSGADAGTNFSGVVKYGNDTPAQFVQVELWTDGESSWRTITTTDRMGKFHAGAPCMVVQYKIDAPGYVPVWGRVDMSMKPCRVLEWVTLKPSPKSTSDKEMPASGVIDGRIAAIPPEAKTEFEIGQFDVNSNDYTGAIPHLQKASTLYPRYAEAYQLLSVAQLQLDQSAQAEASLLKAIEIEDKMPRTQYLLGVLYAKTNRADLAERPLTRFAELDPQNPDAFFELAKVCFALKKYQEAEIRARTAIKLKERNQGVHIVLGYALLRQKKVEEARKSFQQFLKHDPDSPMAADMKNMIVQIDQRTAR